MTLRVYNAEGLFERPIACLRVLRWFSADQLLIPQVLPVTDSMFNIE